MSWNIIIFGFGFILGGLTVMLLLGLFALLRDLTVISEFQGTVGESGQDVKNPKIYPPLTVLSGRKDYSLFTK